METKNPKKYSELRANWPCYGKNENDENMNNRRQNTTFITEDCETRIPQTISGTSEG